jgi:hypothetical protein
VQTPTHPLGPNPVFAAPKRLTLHRNAFWRSETRFGDLEAVQTHGVSRLKTFNAQHFGAFPIRAIDPATD